MEEEVKRKGKQKKTTMMFNTLHFHLKRTIYSIKYHNSITSDAEM